MSTNHDGNDQPSPAIDPSAAGVEEDNGRLLSDLTELLLATTTLEDFLTDLARLAAKSLTHPVSCGVTLRRDRRPLTVASSDALALDVDELQYELHAGPCLQAMETGEVVSVTDTSTETRWGGYPAHAATRGVSSSLSIPLTAGGLSVGALNLYSHRADAFDPRDVASGRDLVERADAVLTIALRLGEQAVLTDQLRDAMKSRSIIDQAIGILMAQQHCSSSTAFELLRSASSHRNRKLSDISADIVANVSGQAATPSPFDA